MKPKRRRSALRLRRPWGRWVAIVPLAALVAASLYWFVLRDTTAESHVAVARAVATIGSGSTAVAVGPDGQILAWLPLPEGGKLPQLPLSEPPKGGQLAGTALQQVRVLAATPAALRRYVASSRYGESGVDVELSSGIELRFGDASQAGEKWKAAAAVLADPKLTALDYVDLNVPGRPSVGGSGHTLPPLP